MKYLHFYSTCISIASLYIYMLQADDNPSVKLMLDQHEKKHTKYTCHKIQNEILSIMAKVVLQKIVFNSSPHSLQL